MKYRITYVNKCGEIRSAFLEATSRLQLAQTVEEKITDMKDNNSDSILRVEVCTTLE